MLRANAAASYFIAQFGQADIFESRNVLDDVFEIIDVGKVCLHCFVEFIYCLGQLLAQGQSQQICKITRTMEDNPLGFFVQNKG